MREKGQRVVPFNLKFSICMSRIINRLTFIKYSLNVLSCNDYFKLTLYIRNGRKNGLNH